MSAILLLINLIVLVAPSLLRPLAFMPARAGNPLYVHTYVTYAFITVGLLDWLRSSVVLVLCGQVVEPRLSRRELVLLVLASVVLGAILFMLLQPGAVFIGAGSIGAGYMGAFVACCLFYRRELGRWAFAGAIYVSGAFIIGLLSGSSIRVLIVLVGILAAVFTFGRLKMSRPAREKHNGFMEGQAPAGGKPHDRIQDIDVAP